MPSGLIRVHLFVRSFVRSREARMHTCTHAHLRNLQTTRVRTDTAHAHAHARTAHHARGHRARARRHHTHRAHRSRRHRARAQMGSSRLQYEELQVVAESAKGRTGAEWLAAWHPSKQIGLTSSLGDLI